MYDTNKEIPTEEVINVEEWAAKPIPMVYDKQSWVHSVTIDNIFHK